jgi:toxin ParE1/3/4
LGWPSVSSSCWPRTDPLQNLTLFPAIGRPQNAEGVYRLVTPKYRYLDYYIIDEEAEEIVILTIQHPARSRDYRDV